MTQTGVHAVHWTRVHRNGSSARQPLPPAPTWRERTARRTANALRHLAHRLDGEPTTTVVRLIDNRALARAIDKHLAETQKHPASR